MTQKSRSVSDLQPIIKFNDSIIKLCGSDSTNIYDNTSFRNIYEQKLYPSLQKKELSRGKSQYIYEFPSLYSIIKQKLFSDLMQQGILIDVIYTIYEADAHIADIAKQRHWKNIKYDKIYDIGAVLSQDSDFLIFDVPYLPLQSIQLNPSSIDGSLIPSESFSSILYNIGLQELSKFINGRDIYSSLMKLCSKEQYQCILPDFATIATNDFYSSEQR